jgi:NADH:ubiquinone oxidoreductase subunit H
MVSYEIAMGFCLVVVLMVSGSMNMIGNLGGALGGVAVPWLMNLTNQSWDKVFYVAAGTYGIAALCWAFIDSDDRLEAEARRP